MPTNILVEQNQKLKWSLLWIGGDNLDLQELVGYGVGLEVIIWIYRNWLAVEFETSKEDLEFAWLDGLLHQIGNKN